MNEHFQTLNKKYYIGPERENVIKETFELQIMFSVRFVILFIPILISNTLWV